MSGFLYLLFNSDIYIFMKKKIILAALFISCFGAVCQTNTLKNGTYEGRSSSIYGNEPYKGVTIITIKNGKIQQVTFNILDTLKNELFDKNYSSHFPTEPLYQKQCIEDWKGVLLYPVQLLKRQDLRSVDAVTGATWSHNLFVSSAKIALTKAGLTNTK